MAVSLAARQVDQHMIRGVPACVRLGNRPQFEHRSVILREARFKSSDRNRYCSITHPRAPSHFAYERRELAARVVPDDHFLGFQLLGELFCDVLMKRMHRFLVWSWIL